MEQRELARRLWSEVESELSLIHVELVELELGRYGGSRLLRMYIDKEGGVTIDDCADVSRYIGAFLDKIDLIDDEYMLEVSSPGIDRPVRKPEDFRRFLGEPIRLQTESPVNGRKKFSGTLTDFDGDLITIALEDSSEFRIHLENLKKAHLDR